MALLVFLVACEHGQTPTGGLADAPTDSSVETEAFVPQICTAGDPGDATCPVNGLALDSLGVRDATALLVIRPLASAVEVTFALIAGAVGIHAEHPRVLVDGEVAFDFDITFDIAASTASEPEARASVRSPDLTARWSVRFEELAPLDSL